MLYAYEGEVYILANNKFYKLKLNGDSLEAIQDAVKYELPKEKVLVTVEEAKKMLKGGRTRGSNLERERE